ncbi:MAG: hypothetical protein AB7O04_07535 [Hyphomonadaceae bacterium]
MREGRRALMLAAFILSAHGLSACGQSSQAPQVDAPAINLTIGPDGAAGVTGPIQMTIEALSNAAPGYDVAEAQDQIEGDPFTKITLSRGGEAVFDVMPTADGQRVHSIVTDSPEARGPRGEIIGQSTFGQAPAAEVLFCRTPEMHEDFSFICADTETGRFWRAYRLAEGYEGTRAPFAEIDPDAAIAAQLSSMTWVAPRS